MQFRQNPFRIHGAVTGPFFTDRADEVRTIVRTLTEPGAKLLVIGERRMGKTSTLLAAMERARRAGGRAILVDLSTATTMSDVATRLLDAATRGLGKTWKDLAAVFARHVKAALSVRADPVSGLLVPTLQVEARRADPAEQQRTVGQLLDALEAIAADRATTIGIVLDEVQELHALGGEQAEWHLRGVIQHHQHLSYVLAGSRPSTLREMIGPGRAFYGMLDTLAFGAIEGDHLARWIDGRLRAGKVGGHGVGAACVALAGPRTRDVVQLARNVYDQTSGLSKKTAGRADVEGAFGSLIDDMDDALRAQWDDASAIQRDVLRAIAASRTGLTTATTRRDFGLPVSGSIAKAVSALIDERRIVKSDSAPSGYVFDNPYFRGWVIRQALPDLGIRIPEFTTPEELRQGFGRS